MKGGVRFSVLVKIRSSLWAVVHTFESVEENNTYDTTFIKTLTVKEMFLFYVLTQLSSVSIYILPLDFYNILTVLTTAQI